MIIYPIFLNDIAVMVLQLDLDVTLFLGIDGDGAILEEVLETLKVVVAYWDYPFAGGIHVSNLQVLYDSKYAFRNPLDGIVLHRADPAILEAKNAVFVFLTNHEEISPSSMLDGGVFSGKNLFSFRVQDAHVLPTGAILLELGDNGSFCRRSDILGFEGLAIDEMIVGLVALTILVVKPAIDVITRAQEELEIRVPATLRQLCDQLRDALLGFYAAICHNCVVV